MTKRGIKKYEQLRAASDSREEWVIRLEAALRNGDILEGEINAYRYGGMPAVECRRERSLWKKATACIDPLSLTMGKRADRRIMKIAGEIARAWCFGNWREANGLAVLMYGWEWNERSRYQRRHRLSGGGHDVLEIPANYALRWDAKRRRATIGRWQYRKLRGHKLIMEYLPFGDARDAAAFEAEQNAHRRGAMLAALNPGEKMRLVLIANTTFRLESPLERALEGDK